MKVTTAYSLQVYSQGYTQVIKLTQPLSPDSIKAMNLLSMFIYPAVQISYQINQVQWIKKNET